MELLQALVLGIVQGATEFLPVSSSGHLILFPAFLGWEAQSIAFDVTVHIGTLLGVLVALRSDLVKLFRSLLPRAPSALRPFRLLAQSIALATLPVLLIGALFHSLIEEYLRSPVVVAISLAFWGILLYLADRRLAKREINNVTNITWWQALIVGVMQSVALIPGTSRSGMTMMTARWLRIDRATAARFSFLLSVPTIALSASAALWSMRNSPSLEDPLLLIAGCAAAATSGFFVVRTLLAWVNRISFAWFTFYRLVLAVIVLWFLVL